MVDLNTGIDDVRAGAFTTAGVVGVRGSAPALAGDTGETPRSRGLGGVSLLLELNLDTKVGLDNGILLDVVNLYVLC